MKKILWLITAASLLFVSCADEKNESITEIQDRLLQAYISTVHLDTLQPTKLGYYVIKKTEGTGVYAEVDKWIKWDQTIRSLDGTVLSTTIEDTAKKYNLFDYNMQTMHYIPEYAYLNTGYTYNGYIDAFPNMKEGSEYRFIMPPRLLNKDGGTQNSGYSSFIIDIVLHEVIEDPEKYEEYEVLAYRDINFAGLDSTQYNFYFQQTYTAPDTVWDIVADTVMSIKDTTSVVDGKTVYVRYVGRFLDGFVFDTNIADTAKAYEIYNSSNTYDLYSFAVGSSDGSGAITGFTEAVKLLKEGDKCVTFFTSPYGYYYSGNSSSSSGYYDDYGNYYEGTTTSTVIQAFTPLFFEITLVEIAK